MKSALGSVGLFLNRSLVNFSLLGAATPAVLSPGGPTPSLVPAEMTECELFDTRFRWAYNAPQSPSGDEGITASENRGCQATTLSATSDPYAQGLG
jgi:hypothetical protein